MRISVWILLFVVLSQAGCSGEDQSAKTGPEPVAACVCRGVQFELDSFAKGQVVVSQDYESILWGCNRPAYNYGSNDEMVAISPVEAGCFDVIRNWRVMRAGIERLDTIRVGFSKNSLERALSSAHEAHDADAARMFARKHRELYPPSVKEED